jgi:hypothetical protein
MILTLNYKITGINKENKFSCKYNITYNGKQCNVGQDELVKLINATNAKDRNCKIVKNVISLKQGYGTLKTLKYGNAKPVKQSKEPVQNKGKGYVEMINLKQARKSDMRYIEYSTIEFTHREFKEYKPYYDLLQLEGGTVLADGTHIKTRFGETYYSELSSGMKSLLLLAYMIDHEDNFIIDLSSCSSNYLDVAFKRIAKSNKNIKVVVRHKDILTIETPIKVKGKIYEDGLEYFDTL